MILCIDIVAGISGRKRIAALVSAAPEVFPRAACCVSGVGPVGNTRLLNENGLQSRALASCLQVQD